MTSVPAAQLIYGNVEAEDSPSRRGGFQTLFFTRDGLTAAEVNEIEARLAAPPKAEEAPRYLFFPVGLEKIAAAQSVPLAGTDRYGRGGLFVAHALVFLREEFIREGLDPFNLFETSAFATTVPEALARGDAATRDLVQASVYRETCRDDREKALETLRAGLAPDDLLALWILAARAAVPSEPRAPLVFVGPGVRMAGLLNDLFVLLPAPLRAACTFDTQATAVARGSCWAVGIARERGRLGGWDFDLAAMRFVRGELPEPSRPYERWLSQAIRQPSTSDLGAWSEVAFWLGEWFEGHATQGLRDLELPAALFRHFAASNRPLLELRLQGLLRQDLGPTLAQRLQAWAADWICEIGSIAGAESGFPPERLIAWLTELFLDVRFTPTHADLWELGTFLNRDSDRARSFLGLVYLRWSRRWRDLATRLRSLPNEEWSAFASWALDTVGARAEWTLSPQLGSLQVGSLQLGPTLTFERDRAADGAPLIHALLDVPPVVPHPLPPIWGVPPMRRAVPDQDRAGAVTPSPEQWRRKCFLEELLWQREQESVWPASEPSPPGFGSMWPRGRSGRS